ncbi:carboxypeptidase-like regulatory domain-containing protein [Flavobacterium terrae]|uniref:CarboxypepD_reg-like domain-containing protein n=1 Tax=Flavobacterium terrae TaxID=415425 RepID=A0A1M6GV96_9FLAO|nr:carboxypeptidase-like regulatory domain-containing protein [Flavobacterium terrae]SHJ13866.1 CarboxypepD_reg-like domain-containing protein [Flavobacterium terrae]
MSKIIYFFICLLTFTSSFSQQNYVLFLKDSATKEPIQSATITVKNSGFGTVSNDEGAFQIYALNNAEITISHLQYKTTTITLDKIADKTNTIFLDLNTLELEDIIVTKEPIHELLYKAVETSRNKFNKPIVLNTYYREFVKVNDKYTRFTDGLIDYHMSGSKADLIVNQSRAAKLITEDDETLDLASGLDVRHATTKQYTFYTLEKIIFDGKNYKDYDFELKSRIEKSGSEVYIINFKPKEDLKKYLYKGTVVFNPESYLITDVDIASDQTKLEYTKVINILIVKAALLGLRVKSTYKITDAGNYVLAFSTRKGKLKIWNKKKYNETLEYKSDLVVTDFKKDDLNYNRKDVYNDRSLYKRGNKYSDKFWQKNNSMVLTDDEAQIIKKLELESNSVN